MLEKHAYLFMVYNNINVLEKSLKLIDNKKNDIYIHIDIKSNIMEKLKKITDNLKFSNVYYTQRLDVRWGDYSQIDCELLLLKEATSNLEYQYYHLLSESDLPIKSQEEIHNFFSTNNGKEFIEFQEFPKNRLFSTRFKVYNIFTRDQKEPNKIKRYVKYVIRKIFTISQLFVGYDRTKKFNKEIKYGSNWFSITDKLARYVIEHESIIKEMFEHGVCVDEHFLQTLVFNSDFRKDVYKEGNMRLIIWKNNANSPYVFKIENYDDIVNSNKLFARKFSENIDLKIVDKIYNNIKEKF